MSYSLTYAYLVCCGTKKLELAGRHNHENYSLLLYTPNPEGFERSFIKDTNEHDRQAISGLLEKYKEKKNEFQMSLFQKYDSALGQFRISLKVVISQGFVDNLVSIVPEPRVSVEVDLWFRRPTAIFMGIHKFKTMGIPLTAGESMYEMQFEKPLKGIPNFEHKSDFNYSVTLLWLQLSPYELFLEVRSTVLESLWNDKLLMDCTIVASNKAESRCHRSVLGAHSNVLLTMFTSGLKESQTNRIEMDDMSHQGVTNLLAYMYGRGLGVKGFTEQVAFELLQAAHKYNITRLEQMLVNIICRKPSDWFTNEYMLAFYFFSLNISTHQVLCEKMLCNMKMNPNEVQATSYYKEMMEKNPKEVAELALKLFEEK